MKKIFTLAFLLLVIGFGSDVQAVSNTFESNACAEEMESGYLPDYITYQVLVEAAQVYGTTVYSLQIEFKNKDLKIIEDKKDVYAVSGIGHPLIIIILESTP